MGAPGLSFRSADQLLPAVNLVRMHPMPFGQLRNRHINRSASSATFALNAASKFLRDFVISLAPSVKTEQDASHLNGWSQIRGPLQGCVGQRLWA